MSGFYTFLLQSLLIMYNKESIDTIIYISQNLEAVKQSHCTDHWYARARNTKVKLWTGTPKTPGNSTRFFLYHPWIFHVWKFHLLFLQYAISESAQPFSFLDGVHDKLCKLDFELYKIHAKKLAFCNTFAYVPSAS